MKLNLVIAVLILLSSCKDNDKKSDSSMPIPLVVPGLTLSLSETSFDDTYATLRNTIDANANIKIIAEVNHMANAASVDLELNPTCIIFFGNPNLGTPLMQKNQLAGLDLPQKIITYQDANNNVYVGFNATNYLIGRHQLESVETLPIISNALTKFITKSTGNDVIVSPSTTVISNEGIITKASTQSFDNTYTTLKTTIKNNPNLKIIAEINHQENAANAGLELRPTRLIIFGNPKLGTPLMQNKLTTAIDLPQKMLVWEGKNGAINVSYNTPKFLKLRHGIKDNDTILETINNALDNISNKASGL